MSSTPDVDGFWAKQGAQPPFLWGEASCFGCFVLAEADWLVRIHCRRVRRLADSSLTSLLGAVSLGTLGWTGNLTDAPLTDALLEGSGSRGKVQDGYG